ncbi:MAG: DUF4328 domain-containing protein [Candidatus Melainabacteria bacterium]|nr:DUF4328 domain-containing protein [Candidatus Melainabacteria bacterium]
MTISLALFVFSIVVPFLIGIGFGLAGIENVPDMLNLVLQVMRTGAYVAVATTFIAFLRISFRNLTPLKVKGKKNKEWYAYGGFIVPIASFVIPCSMVDEIWRGSDPSNLDSTKWKECKHSMLIYSWWGFWLVHGIARLSSIFFKKSEIESITNSFLVLLFADISLVISSLLLIKIVTKISKRQNEKYSLISDSNNKA